MTDSVRPVVEPASVALRRSIMQRARASTILRNTSWVLAGQVARVLLQLVYLLVITRALQSAGYGMFEAAFALVSIVAPFSGWGASNLLVMHVARERTVFAPHWGNVIVKTVVSGALLSAVMTVAARIVVPEVPVALVLALAFAIYFANRITQSAAEVFQAVEIMAVAAALSVLPYAIRLAALAAALSRSPHLTAQTWGLWYLASAALAAAIAYATIVRRLGAPSFDARLIRGTIKQGADFTVGIATDAIYSDVDKAMMARLSTLTATGIYAAAYRAVDTAFVPIQAVLYATYPRFFVHGDGGVRRGLAFGRRVLPYTVGLGLAASTCLWSLAFVMPILLGPGYGATADAVRVLAALPSIQSVYFVAGDTLTGSGFQRLRSAIQTGVVLLNVGLNLWLVPLYSWRGAAWATLVSEGSLAVVLWLAVWRIVGRERGVGSR